jgi:hypothetical protein
MRGKVQTMALLLAAAASETFPALAVR